MATCSDGDGPLTLRLGSGRRDATAAPADTWASAATRLKAVAAAGLDQLQAGQGEGVELAADLVGKPGLAVHHNPADRPAELPHLLGKRCRAVVAGVCGELAVGVGEAHLQKHRRQAGQGSEVLPERIARPMALPQASPD